jgi:transposase
LFEGRRVTEAACWGHVLRKFFDGHAATGSPIAEEASTGSVPSTLLRRQATAYAPRSDGFDDRRLALDNNAAERALRGVAVGHKNGLFAGPDRDGMRAAAMYALIQTAKVNGFDPQACLGVCSRGCARWWC